MNAIKQIPKSLTLTFQLSIYEIIVKYLLNTRRIRFRRKLAGWSIQIYPITDHSTIYYANNYEWANLNEPLCICMYFHFGLKYWKYYVITCFTEGVP